MQWCASVLYRCQSLVPPTALQLDLFVTNFNPPVHQSLGSIDAGSQVNLKDTPDTSFSAAPSTIEVKGVALDQKDIIAAQMPEDDYVDLGYYRRGGYTENGELGHEEHQLDLTNFDGDNDERVRGENTLNRALKKEGTLRRAITRKKKESRRTRRISELPPLPAGAGQPRLSQPEPAPPSDGKQQSAVKSKSSHLPVPSIGSYPSRGASPVGWDTSRYLDGSTQGSQHWKRASTASLVSQATSMQAMMQEVIQEPQLELCDDEMRDISIMAEFARPGRPKIELILQDEVSTAHGRVIVGCCGPTTLNAVVRKAVAAQIDPSRVRRGDQSGSIDLVVEEFGF